MRELSLRERLIEIAVVGLPYNLYWGLMTAPLLCFGPIRVPRALRDLLQAAELMVPTPASAAPNVTKEEPCSS